MSDAERLFPLRLGFFASHEGSNLQSILDACRAGTLAAEPRKNGFFAKSMNSTLKLCAKSQREK